MRVVAPPTTFYLRSYSRGWKSIHWVKKCDSSEQLNNILLSRKRVSFAGVFFDVFHARVALDIATPEERAPALFGPGELVRVVPASATHQVAAVRACENAKRIKILLYYIMYVL